MHPIPDRDLPARAALTARLFIDMLKNVGFGFFWRSPQGAIWCSLCGGYAAGALGRPRDWSRDEAWHRGYLRGLLAARRGLRPEELPILEAWADEATFRYTVEPNDAQN